MTQSLFVGVDGGASKCIIRVEDESGNLLGREVSGPANINVSVTQAWDSIFLGLKKILIPLGISLEDKEYQFHAGMGLAGCEVLEAYNNFLALPHPFRTLIISSDAHIACLGAHDGKDGAIIIVGTGSVGFQVESSHITKVSGWGFPHDDPGSGAWLGLQAVKLTLKALDGRMPISELTKVIYTHFKEDLNYLVTWANRANSAAFAELAPFVVQQCQAGDPFAKELMIEAADAIDQIGYALESASDDSKKPLPCSLIGGIAPFIEPYLNESLRARLKPSQSTPEVGAMILIRKNRTTIISHSESRDPAVIPVKAEIQMSSQQKQRSRSIKR